MSKFVRNIKQYNNNLPSEFFKLYLENLITETGSLSAGGATISSTGEITSSTGALHINTNGIVDFNGFKIDFTDTFGEAGILQANSETYASWQPISWLGHKCGELVPTVLTTAPTGWILANDGTIGNLGSGASTRAALDCQSLYVKLWNKYDDTICTVTGGRGSSGSNDFTANKVLLLPAITGRVVACSGTGSGITVRTDYALDGSASHTMTVNEMYRHSHSGLKPSSGSTINASPQTYYGFDSNYNIIGIRLTDTPLVEWPGTGMTGQRSNIENTIYINFMIKL